MGSKVRFGEADNSHIECDHFPNNYTYLLSFEVTFIAGFRCSEAAVFREVRQRVQQASQLPHTVPSSFGGKAAFQHTAISRRRP